MPSLHIVLVEPEIPQNTGNIARTCAVTGAALHLVGPMGLFFGKESAGLPEKLLFQHPEQCVRIPMLGGFRSLNLANSVAIGTFEVLRQWDFPQLECSGQLRDFDWAAAKAAHPGSEFL